jgi:flagellar protein FliO/FliZ
MLKWLRGGNASRQVAVIEALPVDGKRSVILVRRDNIEHLVMVGGRNDLVIERNIMRRPAPKPARRPVPETKGLPSPGVPTREAVAEPPPKSFHDDLGALTRRLEAELRGSPPLRRQSPPLRRSEILGAAGRDEPRPRSSEQEGVDAAAQPRRTDDPERDPTPEAVPNDSAEKNQAR